MTTCGRSWKQPDLPPRNKSAPSWDLPTTIGNLCPQLRSCNSAIEGLAEEGTAKCSEVGGTSRARDPDRENSADQKTHPATARPQEDFHPSD